MFEHRLYPREDELSHCEICGGAEGTLPTDCPGRKLSDLEQSLIWTNSPRRLNFVQGKWILDGSEVDIYV